MTQRTWFIAGITAAVFVAVAGVVALSLFDPNAADSRFPPCAFHVLTGLYCPGCGMTRALHALVHFDLVRALSMNPLFVVSLPLLGLMGAHRWNARPLLPGAAVRVLFNPFVWLAAVMSFGVLRNLPWAPFVWMAPG